MRSVYFKISIWSIAILICSCLLFLVISRANVYRTFASGDLHPRLISQLAVAQRVYETEGKEGLARHLQSLLANYPSFHYYLAGGGHDLVTGEDLSEPWARSNSRLEIFTLLAPLYASVSSADGRYAFIATVPSRMWDIRPYLWYYLVLLCAIAGLGWVLAFQFASPLNQLAEAVHRFGAGDLSARVRSARHDEIGELARAFDQMADRIQTLLTAERRLLQDVSHELRSPLARLSLAAELTRTSPDRETAAARVTKEIGRLTDLVETLLEVTRAEGDPTERNVDDVALDGLLHEVVEDCGIEASVRGCRLLLKGNGHFHLRADRELLRRAIENIVQNAIRHAPQGSSVDVTLNGSLSHASVSIRDYGPGVPPDALAAIFKPFFRLDHSRDNASGGVGLGLAIAQRAVQVHNGQVWAENADPGLRVCVSLPAEHAA
ncbi:MAG TPA: HAMP domain-containing sensor histidine kinase [Bryobacteraceae bacterium]|nr:HAMP domain-containing sensor histidine kinase [Bryobacteraceae bacterium]